MSFDVSNPDRSLPSRRSDALANVTRIVETAAELLADDPDTAVGEIAHRAGVGRSTLYRHFETREALLEAVRRRARDLADLDQVQGLRPAGELAHTAATPLSVPDVLNKVPPYDLGRQIVAEAQRLEGVQAAAIYLIDLQGRLLRKLAGATTFPGELDMDGGVGTEIPREAFDDVRARVASQLPGANAIPLTLRGRAIGMLVVVGAGHDVLRDLAREAAAALALANEYTDALQTVRRAQDTSPAAEIQQNLLPARIINVNGATLAGNVLPGYDVGGDWFDFADNADAVWLGIADVEGNGPRAAGLAAVLLGAFRSARHQREDPAGALALMHEVLVEVAGDGPTATATVGCWNAATANFRWVSAGGAPPLLARRDGTIEVLDAIEAPLGSPHLKAPFAVQHRTLEPGERVILVSDGVLTCCDAARSTVGLAGIERAVSRTRGGTAAATVNAIEIVVDEHAAAALDDDAAVVVLAPHAPVAEPG